MPTTPAVKGDTEKLTEPMSPDHLIKTRQGMRPYRAWCLKEIDGLNRNTHRRAFLLTDKKGRVCIVERLLCGKRRWKLAEQAWTKGDGR